MAVGSYRMDPDKESGNCSPWQCATMIFLTPVRRDLVILFPSAFVSSGLGGALKVGVNRLDLRHYWPSKVNKLPVTVTFQDFVRKSLNSFFYLVLASKAAIL